MLHSDSSTVAYYSRLADVERAEAAAGLWGCGRQEVEEVGVETAPVLEAQAPSDALTREMCA